MHKLTAHDPETQSADLIADNIDHIKALFPEVCTEGKIDFEVLKQLLGEAVEEREEKYGLNWHGKRRARQLALMPSTGTLRPCPADSVDWDTTRNLMIEGDNLEVLKLLQKSYARKVKLIYIDPPYNTGKDFVYPDDYRDNIRNYLKLTGQVEGGRKISSNTEASGRFHTDWLNMMYPRLTLARDLLKEDGVIFISIGDNELANLKRVCDEVFGEDNFIVTFSRMMKSGGAKGRFYTPNIDYILCYSKSILDTEFFRAVLTPEQIERFYNKTETNGIRKGEIFGEERLYKASLDPRPNQRYYIQCPDGSCVIPPGVNFPKKVVEGEKILPTSEDGVWKWIFDRYFSEKSAGNIIFKETNTSALVDECGAKSKWNIYNKLWLIEQQEKGVVPSNFIANYENRQSASDLKSLNIPFDFAKPVNLISYLQGIAGVKQQDIVLDFFSGSATTAHSVMKLNAEDNGSRRFIMVQLPEPCDDKSEAYKAGYKTIVEISKERIRRAAKKIKDENSLFAGDLGFRVFKLDSSNIRAWEPDRDNLPQSLLDATDHLKTDRSEQDILFELLLKLGLDLTIPIEQKTIAGKAVHSIGAGVLLVCLAPQIAAAEVEPLALGLVDWHKELAPVGDSQLVFRDSAFADDVAKTNLTAILQQHGLDNVRSL